jgi:hypothetical protein
MKGYIDVSFGVWIDARTVEWVKSWLDGWEIDRHMDECFMTGFLQGQETFKPEVRKCFC